LVVRNNLEHGEKTRRGPDHERAGRNRDVARAVLPNSPGRWISVTLSGAITRDDGLPVFRYSNAGDVVEARVLQSVELSNHWHQIDQFEGDRYERHLGLFINSGVVSVANVYVGHEPDYD
jgi:hypothetical protein